MDRLNKHVVMAAVVIVLAVIGTIMNSRPFVVQGAGGSTVTIDPAQLPLRVTGSTTVSGSVKIDGTASVNVANSPTA